MGKYWIHKRPRPHVLHPNMRRRRIACPFPSHLFHETVVISEYDTHNMGCVYSSTYSITMNYHVLCAFMMQSLDTATSFGETLQDIFSYILWHCRFQKRKKARCSIPTEHSIIFNILNHIQSLDHSINWIIQSLDHSINWIIQSLDHSINWIIQSLDHSINWIIPSY